MKHPDEEPDDPTPDPQDLADAHVEEALGDDARPPALSADAGDDPPLDPDPA